MFPYVYPDGLCIKEEEGELKIWCVTGFFSAITAAKAGFEFAAGLIFFCLDDATH